MTAETAKRILDAAVGSDQEVEVRDDYSGRGMYGSRTSGIVFSDYASLMVAVGYAAVELADEGDADDFLHEVSRFRFDNMGRDLIAY